MGTHGADSKSNDTETDRRLVERTLAGDRDAFAALHRRYYARIYRLALLRCGNTADAEDIAAETWVKAVTHLPGFRFQGESILPWLTRICTNLVVDLSRQRGGATVVSLDAPTGDSLRALLDGLPGNTPDPHTIAERHEIQALVRARIAALPRDQADAVLLRFLGDLPLKEIAVALGRTEGAVKALLHRATVNLRRTLLEDAKDAAVLDHLRQTNTEDHGSRINTATRTQPGDAGRAGRPF